MPFSFRSQYLCDIKLCELPYDNDERALNRVTQIHKTSRINISTASARSLWFEFFHPIWCDLDSIPRERDDFDDWIKEKINTLSRLISDGNELKIGLSQKFINLFLKDLWAFYEVDEQVSDSFHIPIDFNIISRCKGHSWRWKSWTKVIASSDEDLAEVYEGYFGIQVGFRDYLGELGTLKPLELDQLLWHRVAVFSEPPICTAETIRWEYLLEVYKDCIGLSESWYIYIGITKTGKFAWRTSGEEEESEAPIEIGSAISIAKSIEENAADHNNELIEALEKLVKKDSQFIKVLMALKIG